MYNQGQNFIENSFYRFYRAIFYRWNLKEKSICVKICLMQRSQFKINIRRQKYVCTYTGVNKSAKGLSNQLYLLLSISIAF